MDDISSMATGRYRRWAAASCGADPSDPTTWYAWAHRGHRLWAAMPDAFWIYMYKVHRCPQLSSHDWTRCPYAHNGERARRRNPRRFSYLAVTCPAFRESQQHQHLARTGAAASCMHGLQCRYAHGVFELWLHPARFRTTMCQGGLACPRRVCFFAHFPAELRAENDPVPLAGLPPLPPLRVPPAPEPLSFPRRVDLAMQAMLGKVRLYDGDDASSSSPTAPAVAAVATATPVLALPLASVPDDDEDPAAGKHGSVYGDYPHFDLIRDMVDDDERES
ncbi:zinc finger CCCH domain-containing protein 10 [Setaria viridis]|nr:zinc finger CCCH domain-containing protein 10-like [Setaria viridis]